MKIIWSPESRVDLRGIYRYVSADNPRAARKLQKRIEQCVALLVCSPGLGRPGRCDGTRELVVAGTPYIVPYRIKGKTLEIIRVYHAARLWPEDFEA